MFYRKDYAGVRRMASKAAALTDNGMLCNGWFFFFLFFFWCWCCF
jgi:hypothetical protein